VSARDGHWVTALSRDGQGFFDETLLNDEDRLREVYQRLEAKGAGAGGGPVRHH